MYGNSLNYLAVEMEAGAFLPLGPLFNDPDLYHLGAPYAAVSGHYHCDDKPTTDLPTGPGLGLPPLGGKTAGLALRVAPPPT